MSWTETAEQFKYLGKTLTDQNFIQEEIRNSLVLFGAESHLFQFDIQKYKDYDIQNYNFDCCFGRVWNLVAHTEGGT